MKYLFSIQLEYLNKGLVCVSLCLRVAVVNSYLFFTPSRANIKRGNEKVLKSQPSDMLSVFSIGFQQYSGLQSTEAAGTSCTADACSIGLCSSLDELITGRYKGINRRPHPHPHPHPTQAHVPMSDDRNPSPAETHAHKPAEAHSEI